MKLYTIGYARCRSDRLARFIEQERAVLIDVRYVPFTEKPGFSKGDLASRFGERYRHIEAFGNRNYQGGPVQLHDAAAGLAAVESLLDAAAPAAIVLMCGCADYRACHRAEVAHLCAKRFDAEAPVHLDRPGQPVPATLFD